MDSPDRNETPRLWMPDEAARYLGVEESTVKQWAKLGRIPHRRAGTLIRFDKDELDEWSRNGGHRAVDEPAERAV